MARNKFLTLCIVLVVVAITNQVEAFESSYDPELPDGIPVMSAESVAPSYKWRYNDHMREPTAPSRRSADSDLDDNLEEEDDEDRDDYNKAGSSNHDSYENPAFGESRRAAKDGEDIESFFDKHLGPPQDNLDESGSASGEIPIRDIVPAGREYDDQYEAAASSPLASIFHSIINAHKRPLVITTEEESSSASDSKSPSSDKDNNQASSSTRLVGAPVGKGYDGSSPIAYLAPMIAAPSSLAEEGYEQGGSPNQDDQSQDDGVREIIITRRPASFISHLQGYSPSNGRLAHQSSNNHWQNAAFRQTGYSGNEPTDQSDYTRYPVAASYAHQHQQQDPAGNNDEQTVSYGLSFGASNEDDQPEEQTNAAEEPAGYPSAYGRMRNSASMLRPYQNYQYQPVYNRPMYNRQQYYQQQQQLQQQQQQMLQAQQQSPYNGARYHKDPSESVAQPVSSYVANNAPQYSQQADNQTPVRTDAKALWLQRQRLLADLDRQIKSNPYYAQPVDHQNEQQSSNNHALRAAARRVVVKSPLLQSQQQRQQHPASHQNDIDTYSSYHSEVDPYKSFTSSSRIVSEPAQAGGYRVASGFDGGSQRFGTQPLTSAGQQHNYTQDGGMVLNNNQDSNNLLTGPVANADQSSANVSPSEAPPTGNKQHLRVRREDSDERDAEDADDDGVWVDDDEDDDNRQQSSDLNETAQEPEEDEAQQGEMLDRGAVSPPGVIGGPHGFELSPDDLMVYHG